LSCDKDSGRCHYSAMVSSRWEGMPETGESISQSSETSPVPVAAAGADRRVPAVGSGGEILDALVRDLNRLQNRAGLELAVAMGGLIVERFYGGDLSRWRQHRAREISFRKLAARADRDLRVSPTLLYRAVALYELTSRLGPERIRGLSMTHLRIVLGLPAAEQAALLEAAIEEKWPSERLDRAAAKVRLTLARPRGRPAAPPLVRALRKLAGTWERVESAVHVDEQTDLSDAEAQRVSEALTDIRKRLDKVDQRLASRIRRRNV
jgi:hypothetical protein